MNSLIASFILNNNHQLTCELVEKYYAENPQLFVRYGERGKQKCLEDSRVHFEYLAQAILTDSVSLLTDYIAWAKILLAQYGMTEQDLACHLQLMQQVLNEALPVEQAECTSAYLEICLTELSLFPNSEESVYDDSHPLTELAKTYQAALLNRQRQEASALILNAVQNGVSIKDIYLHVFQPCLREIGRLWQLNQISVAHEHYCTASTQLIISQLYPYLFSTHKNGFRLVATCIQGNLHEIGVRMIADFFEMEGWDTVYLGANTPIDSVIAMVIEHQADILAISVTLGLHLGNLKEMIEKVHQQLGEKRPKILVGGVPFSKNPQLWKTLKADGYGRDAMEAIKVAQQLVMST